MLIALCYHVFQVLENTCSKRSSRPVSAALSCPNSVEFWADGAIREDARPACYGFSTSAHPPSFLLENRFAGAVDSARSMTMPSVFIDRATAARINPLISVISAKDTLATCAELIRAIGYATSTADEAVCTQMFRLSDAVAAAVEFEVEGGAA